MSDERYGAHVAERQRCAEQVLEATGHDALVIHSGTPFTYFADDQDAPFRTTPHFASWLPLTGPGHLLEVRRGERPRVIRWAPEDYWYEQAPLGEPFWAQEFEVREVGDPAAAFEQLSKPGPRIAFVGDDPVLARRHGFGEAEVNPVELVARLDWARSYKTDYEVACIEEATRKAARGHVAARAAFLEGASELEIHHAYVQAVGCTDQELPYESIVALNEKGAILHYLGKRTERNGTVLLIDTGARHQGYASDITRTWTRDGAEDVFVRMVQDFDRLQQELCAEVRPGLPYPELQESTHRRVAALLAEVGVFRVSADEAMEKKLTRPFFPHGVGHFLGIQVHDVAGRQLKPSGGMVPPPADDPFLRTTREIQPRQVFTIEPGLYFIPMLLRPFREGADAAAFDWDLVDRLTPMGGIRIEDNLVVTEDGFDNLTRRHLA